MTLHQLSVFSLVLTGAAICPIQSIAQDITPAKSGTLHYFEGRVSIDGQAIHQQRPFFGSASSQIHEQSVLRTGRGRAEVLVAPGVFLCVGENSAIRMLDERMIATRVEILEGSVMVDSDDPQSPVTLVYRDYQITPVGPSLTEVIIDKNQMKVYKGEVEVSSPTMKVTVHQDHEVTFNATLATETFPNKKGDDLYVWTRRRSAAVKDSPDDPGMKQSEEEFMRNRGTAGTRR